MFCSVRGSFEVALSSFSFQSAENEIWIFRDRDVVFKNLSSDLESRRIKVIVRIFMDVLG